MSYIYISYLLMMVLVSGLVASDVLGCDGAVLGPPVSGVCPRRPLLLRSDVPFTPEGSAQEPSADSASASSDSGLTVSPSYRPQRGQSEERDRGVHDPYVVGVLAGMRVATDEGRDYVFPRCVMDSLAMQESLGDVARRRRKRKKEDEAPELEDSADVAGGSTSSRRDDNPDGGGQGAAGEGCPLV